MKRASLERLARRLAAVLLLLGIAALILYICYMDANAGKITFDAVVKEDTLLLGESGQDYVYILVEDGETQCIDISQDTRITDEDGRKLDLTEGVELKAGQPIRVTAHNLVYYEPVQTFETCSNFVILSRRASQTARRETLRAGLFPFAVNASQSSRPQARRKGNLFSPGTCASEKTLLRPQVWPLSARYRQRLRAADCIPLEKGALHLFRLWLYFLGSWTGLPSAGTRQPSLSYLRTVMSERVFLAICSILICSVMPTTRE